MEDTINESIKNPLTGGKKKGKLLREAEEYKQKLGKRGVIYISRIPPFMKPNKVRTMLDHYGEITRLYLAEEDSMQRKKRKDNGGNGSKQFSEGWIEFADKRVAKQVAQSLNNTVIGGKKSSFYHDDIWNLKYLKGFKWDYLTEKFAYEKRVKENKLKVAMMHAKRSNAEIVDQIEKTTIQKHIQERKRKQADANEVNSTGSINNSSTGNKEEKQEVDNRFKFKQTRILGKDYGENVHRAQKGLLTKVFAGSEMAVGSS